MKMAAGILRELHSTTEAGAGNHGTGRGEAEGVFFTLQGQEVSLLKPHFEARWVSQVLFPGLTALILYCLWHLAQTLAEEMRPEEKAHLSRSPRRVPAFS